MRWIDNNSWKSAMVAKIWNIWKDVVMVYRILLTTFIAKTLKTILEVKEQQQHAE